MEQTTEAPKEVKQEESIDNSDQSNSEILIFLKSLKLESYHDVLCENGADKLGQLIYVDEAVIDQLCTISNMKVVHAGVFKRAIKECKINARMSNTNEPTDRPNHTNKYDPDSISSLNVGGYSSYTDARTGIRDRRRSYYAFEGTTPNNNSHNQPPLLHLCAAAQATQESSATFNRSYTPYGQSDAMIARQNAIETNNEDRRMGDLSFNLSDKSLPPDDYPNDNIFNSSSYCVKIYDKPVKFPGSVKKLTYIDRIDSERREIVRKGSQIYGRDDTKRKHNELTPLEIFMNEIAYEICLRDFTFMISRQRLLGLVREIIKDNQIQLSSHHPLGTPIFTTYVVNNKSKDKLKAVTISDGKIVANGKKQEDETDDYEIILYHKMNREWPGDITKERRKYLGRRSCNFDLIEGNLCYGKDGKNRRWVHDENELKTLFEENHIDPDSGCHYTREATIERIVQRYYCKNMNDRITKLYLNCELCRSRQAVPKMNYAYDVVDEPSFIPIVENDDLNKDANYEPFSSSKARKRPLESLPISKQPKKSRKSAPQRFMMPLNSESIPAISNESQAHFSPEPSTILNDAIDQGAQFDIKVNGETS